MLTKTRAILLQSLKHKDDALLLKLLTADKGLITCYIRNSRTRTRKAVKWQILDIIDVELVHKEGSELWGIRECSYAYIDTHRYEDPYRLSVSFFIAEVMLRVITEKNVISPDLYAFTEEHCRRLNESEVIALFPVIFLVDLADVLGIKPHVEPGGDVFNFSEGSIAHSPSGLHSISVPEVILLAEYIATGTFRQPVPRESRSKMFQLMLDFYKYHLHGFMDLKTPAVLRELLN